MKKYVYFVRHAESQANVSEKNVIGSHNLPVELTEKGKNQATALGEYFKSIGISFTKAYSSTAVRTQQTAEFCFKAMGCSLSLQTTDLLLEQFSGGWAGKSRDFYNRTDVRNALDTDNWNYVPGDDEPGESQAMVANRMANWINDVVKPNEPSEQDEHIIVFAHGNALRYL